MSVRYEESSKWDFLRPVRSRAKGKFVDVHPVRGIKWKGLRQSGTKSCEMRAVLVLPVRGIKLDFIHPVRSREKEGLVFVHLVRTRSKGGLFLVCLV